MHAAQQQQRRRLRELETLTLRLVSATAWRHWTTMDMKLGELKSRAVGWFNMFHMIAVEALGVLLNDQKLRDVLIDRVVELILDSPVQGGVTLREYVARSRGGAAVDELRQRLKSRIHRELVEAYGTLVEYSDNPAMLRLFYEAAERGEILARREAGGFERRASLGAAMLVSIVELSTLHLWSKVTARSLFVTLSSHEAGARVAAAHFELYRRLVTLEGISTAATRATVEKLARKVALRIYARHTGIPPWQLEMLSAELRRRGISLDTAKQLLIEAGYATPLARLKERSLLLIEYAKLEASMQSNPLRHILHEIEEDLELDTVTVERELGKVVRRYARVNPAESLAERLAEAAAEEASSIAAGA